MSCELNSECCFTCSAGYLSAILSADGAKNCKPFRFNQADFISKMIPLLADWLKLARVSIC